MRYREPKELKGTGIEWIGEIPNNWSLTKIKRGYKVQLGKMLQGDQKNKNETEEKYLRAANITWRGVDYSDIKKMWFSPEEKEKYALKDYDLLVTEGGDVGRSAIFVSNGPDEYFYQNALNRVRGRNNNKTAFLYYWIYTLKHCGYIDLICGKSTIAHLTAEKLERLPIYLPTKPEQRSITTFLDRKTEAIDELIQKKEQLIERLKEKRQALITQAVTKGLDPDVPMKDSGIEWLGDIPEHWETKKLKYIKEQKKNSFVDGPFGSSLKSKHFVKNGDVYVVESNFATTGKISTDSLKKISKEHFEEIRRSECKGGDIIIAKIGAQYGLSNILPELDKPAVVSGNSLKLTVNQEVANTQFVHQALLNIKWSGSLSVVVNTTAQPALSLSIMNNIEIAVPPKDEQLEIVNHLKRIKERYGSMTAQLRNQINKLKEYRQSLISAAVTGKIDVRDEVEVESNKMMA